MTARPSRSNDPEQSVDDTVPVPPRPDERIAMHPAMATITSAGPRRRRRVEAPSRAPHAPSLEPWARSSLGTWSTSFDPATLMPPVSSVVDRAKAAVPVDGYAIEEVIGAGGMGVVHRARQLKSGRVVALKIMPEHFAHDERRVARFRREIRANARLDHDNIVRVIDFGADDDQLYLANELVDGGSLHDIMCLVPRIHAAIAVLLIDDLLSGLAHAHARGVIHRDLKPANLLLTRAGRLKINDFGVAVAHGEPALTAPGDRIGTPSYMSPEQASGLPTGPASDLFSVGTILYEMLTGVNPFAHVSQSLTLASVSAGSVIPIFEVDPSVPAGLERLLEVLMETDVDRRCDSAAHALDLLRAARASMPPSPAGIASKFLAEPRLTVERLRVTQAYAEIDRAKALLAAHTDASAQAAFLTYCATTLAPNDPEAFDLQLTLTKQFGYHFLAAPSPALRAMEAMMYEVPDVDELIKQAAIVAREDGDLLRAAVLFKRHLRAHPSDADTRARLANIVGEDLATPVDHRAARVGHGPLVTRPERAHVCTRSEAPSVHAPARRDDETDAAGAVQIGAALFPRATVLLAAATWIGARLYTRRRHAVDADGRNIASRGRTRRHRHVDTAEERDQGHGPHSGDTSRAIATALRIVASARDPTPLAAPVRTLLERAACSFVLSETRAALADLSAGIAMISPRDSRRYTLATVVSALEHRD